MHMSESVDYIIAEGPEGLEKVLNELLIKVKADPIFAEKEHAILYQLGGQKSVLLVETKQMPFKIWHYDLMGRPETLAVKETLARFLWEKCGEKERYMQEMADKK